MPRPTPPLTLITDTSPATVDALARSYASSFSLDTFYPSSVQFAGLPKDEQEHWHLLQMKQVAYRSLVNPEHEVWTILEGDGEAPEGAVGDRDVAALFILKKTMPKSSDPTPYDAELEKLPEVSKKRLENLVETTGGLTRDYYPDECYHVSWLGVVPGHQGKGYGGAMTRYALQRGKDAGENVRLHTHNQENVNPFPDTADGQVNFYARYGFESKGKVEFDIDGVPHEFWCLVSETGKSS